MVCCNMGANDCLLVFIFPEHCLWRFDDSMKTDFCLLSTGE